MSELLHFVPQVENNSSERFSSISLRLRRILSLGAAGGATMVLDEVRSIAGYVPCCREGQGLELLKDGIWSFRFYLELPSFRISHQRQLSQPTMPLTLTDN